MATSSASLCRRFLLTDDWSLSFPSPLSRFFLRLRTSFETLRHADAFQSGTAPASRGARPALLCDEGAGERFYIFHRKPRHRKIQWSRGRVIAKAFDVIFLDSGGRGRGFCSLILLSVLGHVTLVATGDVFKGSKACGGCLRAQSFPRDRRETVTPNNASSFSFFARDRTDSSPRQLLYPLRCEMEHVTPPDQGKFQGTLEQGKNSFRAASKMESRHGGEKNYAALKSTRNPEERKRRKKRLFSLSLSLVSSVSRPCSRLPSSGKLKPFYTPPPPLS